MPATTDEFGASSPAAGAALGASATPAPPSPNATPSVLPSDNENPAIPHPVYFRMLPRWQKCRDLMLGIEAIRAGGEKYLPKFDGESDDSYTARQNMAALYNGYSRVVLASVGMLMQQEPVLSDDMPKEIVDLWENLDGAGTHGAVMAAELTQAGIIDGLGGLFADYENTDAPSLNRANASAAAVPGVRLSADDEKRLGLRPYLILFKADNIIKEIYETINGSRTLVLLVLRENIDQRVGSFGVIGIVRYRVYTFLNGVVSYQLWTCPIGQVRPILTTPPRAMKNVKRIPWSPLRSGRKLSAVEVVPPLMDLADMNIEHHQTKTNLLHLENIACVPSLVRIGAMPDDDGDYPPITIGPRSTIEAPNIQGVTKPIYWESPDVTVLEPARKTLEATEMAMGAMGLAFLAPQPRVTETAAAKRLDATAQNATLATVGRAVQDCLEMAVGFLCEYLGVKAGSVSVNNDFENLVLDAQTMIAYVNAVASAGLPVRILVQAWQAGGRIPDDIDVEELLLEIETNRAANADAAATAAAATNPTGNGSTPPNANANGNGKIPPGGFKIKRNKKGKTTRIVPA